MSKKHKAQSSELLVIERHDWLLKNRGILQRIAVEFHVSRIFVSQVFNGHRPSFKGRIEERLRQLGAPGWPAIKPVKREE